MKREVSLDSSLLAWHPKALFKGTNSLHDQKAVDLRAELCGLLAPSFCRVLVFLRPYVHVLGCHVSVVAVKLEYLSIAVRICISDRAHTVH